MKTAPAPYLLMPAMQSWASRPLTAPPLVMATPLFHSSGNRDQPQAGASPEARNRWSRQPKSTGVSRAHHTRSRTGRPRWKARMPPATASMTGTAQKP